MTILSFKEAQLSPLRRHPADDSQKGLWADVLGADGKILRIIGWIFSHNLNQTTNQTNLALKSLLQTRFFDISKTITKAPPPPAARLWDPVLLSTK